MIDVELDFALRLSFALHKTLNELSELENWEINLYIAWDNLYGLPDTWLQTGVMAASVAGGKPRDYTPRKMRPKSVQENKMAIESIIARQKG